MKKRISYVASQSTNHPARCQELDSSICWLLLSCRSMERKRSKRKSGSHLGRPHLIWIKHLRWETCLQISSASLNYVEEGSLFRRAGQIQHTTPLGQCGSLETAKQRSGTWDVWLCYLRLRVGELVIALVWIAVKYPDVRLGHSVLSRRKLRSVNNWQECFIFARAVLSIYFLLDIPMPHT
jgi:hypothetical protein